MKRYRIFKFRGPGDSNEQTLVWFEVGRLDAGKYGGAPEANDLGKKWGEGTFLILEDATTYGTIDEVTIIGRTEYAIADAEVAA